MGNASDAKPEVPKSRSRRCLRRLVTGVLVVVLLIACYVGWWCCSRWNSGNNVVSRNTPWWVFRPLDLYVDETTYPGSDTLFTLKWWLTMCGSFSWEECHAILMCSKYYDCRKLDDLWEADESLLEESIDP